MHDAFAAAPTTLSGNADALTFGALDPAKVYLIGVSPKMSSAAVYSLKDQLLKSGVKAILIFGHVVVNQHGKPVSMAFGAENALPEKIHVAAWGVPVSMTTTYVHPLEGIGTFPIDSVQPKPGMRILVKDQGNKAHNGIYVIGPGKWTRASDVLEPGYAVFVENGAVHGGSTFLLTTEEPILVGHTPLIFTQLAGL